ARNQQHETDCAKQDQQRPANLARELRSQRHDVYAPVRVESVLLGQPRSDRVHFGLRLLDRDAGFESRHARGETSAAPAEFVGDLKRHPDVSGLADLSSLLNVPAEVCRHYADDCRRLVIQSDLPADDLTVAAEPSLPQTIANHCNAGLSLATLVRLKRPA